MMGRGVTFIEWNCKSVAHRSYQKVATSVGLQAAPARIYGKRPLTPARPLASPQTFPHRFAMQLAQPRAALAGITTNPPD
jgi:hypothetical protein